MSLPVRAHQGHLGSRDRPAIGRDDAAFHSSGGREEEIDSRQLLSGLRLQPFELRRLMAKGASRIGIPERLDHDGSVYQPLDEDALRRGCQRLKKQGVESVAICFLFSFVNPEHERRARVIVAEEAGGRGVVGVIDGSPPKGVEGPEDQAERRAMLRRFGYKQ